jgi:hypothetical protein
MVIKIRRGLKSEWVNNQPVIDVGEMIFFTDTKELFIGALDDNENNLLVPIITEEEVEQYQVGNDNLSAEINFSIDNGSTDWTSEQKITFAKKHFHKFFYGLLTNKIVLAVGVPEDDDAEIPDGFGFDTTVPDFTWNSMSIDYFSPISTFSSTGFAISFFGNYDYTEPQSPNTNIQMELGLTIQLFKEDTKDAAQVADYGVGVKTEAEYFSGIANNPSLLSIEKIKQIGGTFNIYGYAYKDGNDLYYSNGQLTNVQITFPDARKLQLKKPEQDFYNLLEDIYLANIKVDFKDTTPPATTGELPGNQSIYPVKYTDTQKLFWGPNNVMRGITLGQGSTNDSGITFFGDSDTRIHSDFSDNLKFQTGNLTLMVLTGRGNGVGTNLKRYLFLDPGVIIEQGNLTLQTQLYNTSQTATNQISNARWEGGRVAVFNNSSNHSLTIPPYYKTTSQVVDNNSTDLIWSNGANMRIARIGTGNLTVIGSTIVDGAITYRTKFAILGQAGLAIQFDVPLYAQLHLTLVQRGTSGTPRDLVWMVDGPQVTNVVL